MKISDQATADTYYQALLERDPAFTGVFFAGVKTTSVFCIATCRARKPKKENVEFYTHFKEALDAGFRPCKICRPTENAFQAPPMVAVAIDLVRQNPTRKVTDYELREREISPTILRRWFKQHYGMTFQAFARMYRINSALIELKSGAGTLQSAYEAGYESPSGFGYMMKKMLGTSPGNSSDQTVILIDRTTTPLGPMFICATGQGVCLLEFVDRRMLETEFRDLQRLLKARIIAGENAHIRQVKVQLDEYFAGNRKVFDVPLHTPGTEFQTLVWDALGQVPYGTTVSYQAQAHAIGRPASVRAVASANGCNRIAIIIPCHRVIGKNGHLTGYGGGLQRKRWLLEHEGAFTGE